MSEIVNRENRTGGVEPTEFSNASRQRVGHPRVQSRGTDPRASRFEDRRDAPVLAAPRRKTPKQRPHLTAGGKTRSDEDTSRLPEPHAAGPAVASCCPVTRLGGSASEQGRETGF